MLSKDSGLIEGHGRMPIVLLWDVGLFMNNTQSPYGFN